MTEKGKPPVVELFDQAMKNYEQALKAGLKLQEETGKVWSGLLTQATSGPDWQKKATYLANDIVPAAQKRMEECRALIEQNTRTSIDLMKKGAEAASTPGIVEGQKKWMEFVEHGLGAVRANTQAVLELNTKAIDSWLEFVRKGAEAVERKPVGAKA